MQIYVDLCLFDFSCSQLRDVRTPTFIWNKKEHFLDSRKYIRVRFASLKGLVYAVFVKSVFFTWVIVDKVQVRHAKSLYCCVQHAFFDPSFKADVPSLIILRVLVGTADELTSSHIIAILLNTIQVNARNHCYKHVPTLRARCQWTLCTYARLFSIWQVRRWRPATLVTRRLLSHQQKRAIVLERHHNGWPARNNTTRNISREEGWTRWSFALSLQPEAYWKSRRITR